MSDETDRPDNSQGSDGVEIEDVSDFFDDPDSASTETLAEATSDSRGSGGDDDDVVDGVVTPEIFGRPRKLVVAFVLALASFVFIAIAGVALVALLYVRIRDHADPNHAIRNKYETRYSRCVQHGGDRYSCGITVLQACENDHYWNAPDRSGQRDTTCKATVPAVTD
jgi:hypothetical protein